MLKQVGRAALQNEIKANLFCAVFYILFIMDQFNESETSDEEDINGKMLIFPIQLNKGKDKFDLEFSGKPISTDTEKLGIFVKSIKKGGTAEQVGIQINDQIIEVNNKSLVGLSQDYASSVLKSTHGIVHFLIGRKENSENSTGKKISQQPMHFSMVPDKVSIDKAKSDSSITDSENEKLSRKRW